MLTLKTLHTQVNQRVCTLFSTKTFFRYCLLIAVTLLPQTSSIADEYDEIEYLFKLTLAELGQVKVSVSSSHEENLFNTPSSVTVIDKKTIETYHYSNIREALESVPGLDVYQTVIDRNIPTARGILQSFYSNKILILIDNIPTWQPIYGEGSIERININDVEKIEILKGPASVLYGSNAYSGVINIVLKKAQENTTQFYGQIGTDNLLSTGISTQQKFDQLSVFASINIESEEGDTYQVPNATGFEFNGEPNFDYANYNKTINTNLKLNYQKHSVYFNSFTYKHSFLGIHPSYLGGGGKTVENKGALLNYKYQTLFGKTEMLASFSYDYFEREFPVSYDYSNVIRLAGNRLQSEIKFNYLTESLNIEYGFAGEQRHSQGHDVYNAITDEFIRHNLFNDEDVIEWSSYARFRVNFDKLSIMFGSRYTNNSNFGHNISSRFSSVYSLSEQQSFKFIVGQSFRVPTLFEMYFDHPTVIGNAELKPETSTSYEFAYLYGSDKFFMQILGYYGVYEDIIQRQASETGPPQYQNTSKFKGYGSEIEIKYQFTETLSGYFNYNYIQGVDEEIDNNYRFVPDHTISFGLNKHINNFSLSTYGKYISSVEGHLKDISPQFIINANISYYHAINNLALKHVLSIKNISDSDMLTPEYIRQTSNINELITEDFGTRFNYSVHLSF